MIHRIKIIVLSFIFISSHSFCQKTDTLRWFSSVFGTERSILVTTPEFFPYQSKEVRLPVIYILDGQHDWLVNPVKNTIRYLQYTHQIPQVITISIPLTDRVKECHFQNIDGATLPLYSFLTQEVDSVIQTYHPGPFKVLIGHSFSASFALYAYTKSPDYFSRVIAHSPLDQFRKIIESLLLSEKADKNNIFISVGGEAKHKDYYHRMEFDRLEKEFPLFFENVHSYKVEFAGHTSIPIVATPYFLSQIFTDFSGRYNHIASVDKEYRLIQNPVSVKEELIKINESSFLGSTFYPPEIAEYNGIASRYAYNELPDYAIAIYQTSIKHFPFYYDFHWQLADLYKTRNPEKARFHLENAIKLLQTIETENQERDEILSELERLKKEQGW